MKNEILYLIIGILSLLVFLLLVKEMILPFLRRSKEAENQLPDLSVLDNKKFWQVERKTELKTYRRNKRKKISELIVSQQTEEERESLNFEDFFDTKRKITIKRLPEGLIQVDRILNDNQAERESFLFHREEDHNFEDILSDLLETRDRKKPQKNFSNSQKKMDEAFSRLEQLLDEKSEQSKQEESVPENQKGQS